MIDVLEGSTKGIGNVVGGGKELGKESLAKSLQNAVQDIIVRKGGMWQKPYARKGGGEGRFGGREFYSLEGSCVNARESEP